MKKIPTIFERDWNGDRSRVVNIPNPVCDWVFAGEGVATRKYDGACCVIERGILWKRREMKAGQQSPTNFRLVDHDKTTGKSVGWVPVGDGPEDKFFREAFDSSMLDGTYELLGPKVQGNAENKSAHILIRHADAETFSGVPRSFDELRAWLEGKDIEGLVFHHSDGRMAKIKLRDFGLKRASA